MPNKNEILEFINKLIKKEQGKALTLDSQLKDAQIDSLSMFLCLYALDMQFGAFAEIIDTVYKGQNIELIPIRELITEYLKNAPS